MFLFMSNVAAFVRIPDCNESATRSLVTVERKLPFFLTNRRLKKCLLESLL